MPAPKFILSPGTRLDDLERQSRNLRARRAGPTTPQERRDLGYRIQGIEAEITAIRKELH